MDSIMDQLNSDGWELTSVCVEPGSPTEGSKHVVILKRNGQSFSTDYSMGAAHRVWTSKPFMGGQWTTADKKRFGKIKIGEPVPSGASFGRLSVWHHRILHENTGPATPTLDGVLWCLLMDASTVRHGQDFSEWCSDLGYDDDSIKARRTFDQCREIWAGLVRLGADFDTLDELFQDY